MERVSRWWPMGLVLCVAAALFAEGGDRASCACTHCGGRDAEKICRLVCEEKKVTITCWGCQDEDFCAPGRGKRVDEHCEIVCDECESPDGPRTKPQRFLYSTWRPVGSPMLLTKRKLMKRTVTKTVPTYKWVVEPLCAGCEAECAHVDLPPGYSLPPAPACGTDVRVVR